MRIAVFASGSGSNYEAIMRYFDTHQIDDAQIVLLFSDQPEAGVLNKAKKWNTPTVTARLKDFSHKNLYEEFILSHLERNQVDFLVLAGYMRLIGSTLLERYQGKIINIHPSLLPSFPGKDGVGQALQANVRVTGVTIHFVDYGMDTGPIIVQEAVEISLTDNYQTLTEKIQRVEHRLYPEVVVACARKQIKLTDAGVVWDDSKLRC